MCWKLAELSILYGSCFSTFVTITLRCECVGVKNVYPMKYKRLQSICCVIAINTKYNSELYCSMITHSKLDNSLAVG